MLSLNANQTDLVASANKRVKWLFTITTTAPVTYRWSTHECTYGGNTYSFKIISDSFNGIRLFAGKSDVGIQAPNDITFRVSNKDDTLTWSDFKDASVQVELVIDDGVIGDTVIATWKFNVKKCDPDLEVLDFTCEDFIQRHLDGYWPNTPAVKDLWLVDNIGIDDQLRGLCVPVVFGDVFLPLPSFYDDGTSERYFLLGPAAHTYVITKCRTPRELSYKSTWDQGVAGASFDQTSITGDDGISYRAFRAQIVDSDDDGVADQYGGHIWQGSTIMNFPTRFTRDDTKDINGNSTGTHDGGASQASLTDSGASWGVDKLIGAYVVNETDESYGLITDNTGTNVTAVLEGGTDNDWDNGDVYTIGGPASIVRWILLDMGVDSSDIDDSSFGAAELVFAKTWGGLVWNGGFTFPVKRDKVISFLMNMCNSRLVIRDKIYWKVLEKASQQTITAADILRSGNLGHSTFGFNGVVEKREDSGYVEWQPTDEIQDAWQLLLVSAKFSSGAHTGANNVAILTDSNQEWPTNSLIDGTVENITDGSTGTITANTDDDVTAPLGGGAEDDWDTGDTYRINVTEHKSKDRLPAHWIQDVQNAQRAGILFYKRKFLGKSKGKFTGKGTILALEPDDVFTIDGANYGGTTKVLVESMRIGLDVSVDMSFKTYDL